MGLDHFLLMPYLLWTIMIYCKGETNGGGNDRSEAMPQKKVQLPTELIEILSDLTEINGNYLVGGAVRDLVLDRYISDIDLVSHNLDEITCLLEKRVPGRKIVLGENKGQRCIRYVSAGYVYPDDHRSDGVLGRRRVNFDLVEMSKGGIKSDLQTRDFTVNALAIPLKAFISYLDGKLPLDLLDEEIVDPYNGLKDIEDKILREVTTEIFISDPLRLWRLWRFAAELGFKIDESLNNLVKANINLCKLIPGERIRQELILLLNCPHAADHLLEASNIGMLAEQFPEMQPMKGCDQNRAYHCHDVWDHSFQVLFELEKLINQLEQYFTNIEQRLLFETWLNADNQLAVLKLAALLHDIGKPMVKTVQQDGQVRFLNHEKAGLPEIKKIANRLRLSGREKKLLYFLVERHLQIHDLIGSAAMRTKGRFWLRYREATLGLILLGAADLLAKKETAASLKKNDTFFNVSAPCFLDIWLNEVSSDSSLKLMLDGREIIDRFGIEPGPQVSLIKKALWEAQFEGIVNDKEEAIGYILNLLNGIYDS